MNTRILVIALATVLGASAIPAAALAQQTANSQSASQSTTTVAPATKSKAARQRAVPSLVSSMCIRHTGSHIPAPKGQCLPVPGRSYSQQDIQRTGATSLGQALRMLDPSVQVSGGH